MRRVRGFTLLEVMLAFTILAVAMGLLLGMLSRGLGQVRTSQDETEATLYAQSLLDQVGVIEAVQTGQKVGEFDNGRYRYRLETTEIEDPSPAPALPPTLVDAGTAI
ncbi:MAG: prepilin-type N-terminal cleavage/methylation domain-containing protein, partial [Pseudoxanthomonas sp.]